LKDGAGDRKMLYEQMKIKVTKIAAARRQLREAIKMWFYDGDVISMHSLACSAHQIIHDINRKKGGRDLIYDSLLVKDEYRKEWIKIVKSPYNFMKHAENDPDPTGFIEFDQEITEFVILYTCLGLELLGYTHDEMEGAFIIYFMIRRPNFLLADKEKELMQTVSASSIDAARRISKSEFFEVYTHLKRQQIGA
jgi:hypothetical protein